MRLHRNIRSEEPKPVHMGDVCGPVGGLSYKKKHLLNLLELVIELLCDHHMRTGCPWLMMNFGSFPF